MNSKVNETEYKSIVAKYLDLLVEKTDGEGNYIYRGQSSAKWDLNSSAKRRLINQQKLDKKVYGSQDFILYHKHLIENAKGLGYDKNEDKMNQLSELEILAEIQHHGGATCLTDFTTNFLVALWFASERVEQKGTEIIKDKDEKVIIENEKYITNRHGKIFAVNLSEKDNIDKIYPIRKMEDENISGLLEKKIQFNDAKKALEPRFWLWKPTRLNNRIVQQDSIFMFGLPRFKDSLNYDEIYIPDEDKIKLRLELETYFDLSPESVFDDLPGFSFEANNAEMPISTKIFENKNCFEKAKGAFKRGEYETAIKYYNRNIQCLNDKMRMCKNKCKTYEIELFFGRGKCYFYMNRKNTRALNDFERVISIQNLEEDYETIVIGASRLKLVILYNLEYFKDAFRFCFDLLNSKKHKIQDIKEFYFSALELSIILEDNEKFVSINDHFLSNSLLLEENGNLLYFYFNSIKENLPFDAFFRELDNKINKVSNFNSEIMWDFKEIENWIIKKSDSNLLLLTQRIIEIQTRLRNEEIEKLC